MMPSCHERITTSRNQSPCHFSLLPSSCQLTISQTRLQSRGGFTRSYSNSLDPSSFPHSPQPWSGGPPSTVHHRSLDSSSTQSHISVPSGRHPILVSIQPTDQPGPPSLPVLPGKPDLLHDDVTRTPPTPRHDGSQCEPALPSRTQRNASLPPHPRKTRLSFC